MSANTLKIIAIISMTLDHIGFMLFPEHKWLRMAGRIAFPIFAYMIAEGCKYTRNRSNYLLRIGIIGVFMQLILFVATRSLYQSVFISFALSISLIYMIDNAIAKQKITYVIYSVLYALFIAFLCLCLPNILKKTDFHIDYGIIGVLIPVMCYFTKGKKLKLLVFSLSLIALSVFYGNFQWFCLLAIPLIGMYNHQRGKFNLKKMFYIYYPAHICVIFILKLIINC